MDFHWLNLLSQQTRLITLDAAIPQGLTVERFRAREALCESFRFDIDCISASAFIDIRSLISQPMHLRLMQADGTRRSWHGYVTEATKLGADGGLARYRLTLTPWLSFLDHGRNTLVFQDMDVLGICDRVFADYPQAAYRFDVTQTLRARPICTQYRETDSAFVTRLLAEEGLGWRFDHLQDTGMATGHTSEQAQHTLVVFDKNARQPEASPRCIRFHRTAATEAEDAFTTFIERRQRTPNIASTASWRHSDIFAPSATAEAVPDGQPRLEHYRANQAGNLPNNAYAEQTADLMLDGLRLSAHLFSAEGSIRRLGAGQSFTLVEHPTLDGQRFTPLVVEHEAANNLGSNAATLLKAGELDAGNYRQRLLATPADAAIVPAPGKRPVAPGADTARVVGLANEVLTSTRDHQVRVQFDWQRGPTPNPGGQVDTGSTTHPEGHAPGNERSGTWVRIAEASAGANWGHSFTPRTGAEVLIEYQHGDIDQPVIVGQLYNGEHTPPYAAGVDAPANHIGTVSGIQTHGLDGAHPQHWVVDDAPGQLRQELYSGLANSRVAVGYLIDHKGASRGSLQGRGFHANTAGWATLRAPEGLLLSTTARRQAISTQMDIADASGQLAAAIDAADRLNYAAQQPGATEANNAQIQLHTDIAANKNGHYTGKANGQSATKPTGNQRDGGDAVERFDKSHLIMEGPSTTTLATPKSLSAFAGEHLHLTSQDDTHIAAGATVSMATGEHANLYAHNGPVQVVAANGPTSIEAHDDALTIQANQSVTVTSSSDGMEVLAKNEIQLHAGQSTLTLKGTDATFDCPGQFAAKGAGHPFGAAVADPASISPLPIGLVNVIEPATSAEHSPLVFHIGTRPRPLPALISDLYATRKPGLLDFTRSNNPHVQNDTVMPGQVLILGDPEKSPDPEQLAKMQTAAQTVDEQRTQLDDSLQQGVINYWNTLDDLSQYGAGGLGLFTSATGKKLQAVQDVLKEVEQLHMDEFSKFGRLQSPEFFARRKALYKQLDTALGQLTLKYTGFPDSAKIKNQLGLSSKSIVHQWKEAGTAAGGIPGYAENYLRISKYAKYIKGLGYISIGLDGLHSALKVKDVCTAGTDEACEEIKYTEVGRLGGGVVGGIVGGYIGYLACAVTFSWFTGGTSILWCGIVAGGVGATTGGTYFGDKGQQAGELIYDSTHSGN